MSGKEIEKQRSSDDRSLSMIESLPKLALQGITDRLDNKTVLNLICASRTLKNKCYSMGPVLTFEAYSLVTNADCPEFWKITNNHSDELCVLDELNFKFIRLKVFAMQITEPLTPEYIRDIRTNKRKYGISANVLRIASSNTARAFHQLLNVFEMVTLIGQTCTEERLLRLEAQRMSFCHNTEIGAGAIIKLLGFWWIGKKRLRRATFRVETEVFEEVLDWFLDGEFIGYKPPIRPISYLLSYDIVRPFDNERGSFRFRRPHGIEFYSSSPNAFS